METQLAAVGIKLGRISGPAEFERFGASCWPRNYAQNLIKFLSVLISDFIISRWWDDGESITHA